MNKTTKLIVTLLRQQAEINQQLIELITAKEEGDWSALAQRKNSEGIDQERSGAYSEGYSPTKDIPDAPATFQVHDANEPAKPKKGVYKDILKEADHLYAENKHMEAMMKYQSIDLTPVPKKTAQHITSQITLCETWINKKAQLTETPAEKPKAPEIPALEEIPTLEAVPFTGPDDDDFSIDNLIQ